MADSEIKKRRPNWTKEECLLLADLVKARKTLIEGRFGPGITSAKRQEAWKKSLQEADKRINHNFIISTDGRVYEGLGWKALTNEAGGIDRKEIDIGVIGDFTHTSPSDVVLTQIRRVIKCGMENNKIAPNYTLLWEKQVVPSTCTSCNGDKLLCRLMNFGHWGDHQEGGVFIKPRCDDTVPTTPPHRTQKPQPPSSATEAVSTHHLIQSICFIIYIFNRYIFS